MHYFEPTLAHLKRITSLSSISDKAVVLEQRYTMVQILSARRSIRIEEQGESLVPIPKDQFSFAEPHLYLKEGAAYSGASPYSLRQGVVERLIEAQAALKRELPNHRLEIIDGFRPQSVQVYMRKVEHDKYAREAGLDPQTLTDAQDNELWRKVNVLWAPISDDPHLPPPPHSTGAAVDLTIVDQSGRRLEMGSEFDEASPRILPNYYSGQGTPETIEFCKNRELLNRVMLSAGFHRLTHEWWHFSYGDQMWALLESVKSGQDTPAIYGEVKLNH